jgi:hypothetical protein
MPGTIDDLYIKDANGFLTTASAVTPMGLVNSLDLSRIKSFNLLPPASLETQLTSVDMRIDMSRETTQQANELFMEVIHNDTYSATCT